MTRSQKWLLVAASLAAAVAAGVAVVVVTSGPPPGAIGSLVPPPPVARDGGIATSTGPFSAGPVRPPAQGAFLGAWVRPESLTQPGRLAAVTGWEDTLGRQLDIVNTYRRLEEEFFTRSDLEFSGRGATLMLSWAGGDTRMTTMGRHDELIRERARQVRAFGKPVLLRYRWEMDRPGLRASMWSPSDFVAAWRHVRKIFAAEGVTNASWVWCPTVEGFAGGYAQPFYPGDADVDWLCVDVYAGSKLKPLGELLQPFLEWSAQHPTKPVMIGEFGVARAWGTASRASWLRDAATVFRRNPQIRAVLYFESDPLDNKGPTQQFQLSDDPAALAAFRELARQPYFNPRRLPLR